MTTVKLERAAAVGVGKMTCCVVLSCVIASSGGLLYGYDLGISGSILLFSGIPPKPKGEAMTTVKLGRAAAAGDGKITCFVVLSCMIAGSGGLLYGYDLGISGGVTSMDSFLRKFFPGVLAEMKRSSNHVSNYCKFNSQSLVAFTSSLYAAGLVASLLASPFTNRFGRKPSMLLGAALFLAGASLAGAASNISMLILGRVLFGFSIGFTNLSIPLYISEMAPPRYRGAMNGFFEISISLGITTANLVNYGTQKIEAGWGWRLSLSAAALPAAFLLIGSLFLPETPTSIIHCGGDLGEASSILQKLRGTDDVAEELDRIVGAAAASDATLLVRRKYRPHLLMALALPFFQQFSGINYVVFYAPVMFRSVGLKQSASLLSSLLTRITATVSTMAAMAVVDRLGRRKFFFIGGLLMFLSHVLVGLIMATKLGDHGAMGKGYAYLMLVSMCLFVAGFALSWGPMPWLVTSEIFPQEIRAAGQSTVVAMVMLSASLSAQSMLSMLCAMKCGVFFFFGGCVLLMTMFVYWFLPETKGQPLDMMGMVWKDHWFWRRYVGVDDGKKEDHKDNSKAIYSIENISMS